MEYILLAYLIAALIFISFAIRGIEREDYSFKLIITILLLSLVWPIVLTVYFLSNDN